MVIGGGVIGLEMGSVWSRLGSNVTVVEYLPRLIPGTDTEVATQFQKILAKQKFNFKLSTKVVGASVQGNSVQLTVAPAAGGAEEKLTADVVLVSTGRRPYTKNLGLEVHTAQLLTTDPTHLTCCGVVWCGVCVARGCGDGRSSREDRPPLPHKHPFDLRHRRCGGGPYARSQGGGGRHRRHRNYGR